MNRNAKKGEINERVVAQIIESNPQVVHDIVHASTPEVPSRNLKAETSSRNLRARLTVREGQQGEKSDVFIRTTGGYNFGINVKSFQGTGFNQVPRMTIDNFADQFGIYSRK